MQLDIPPGNFAGYIFDLDGTLVDTMPLHYRAWDRAMRQVGLKCPLDEDFFAALAIMPEASGVALGFDRLAMLATGARRIDDVVWVPVR